MNTREFNRYLQLISSGDSRGMEEIYNCYYEKLLLTAELDVKSRENAEDIVSDLMISIFKNAANYTYIKNPNAWLYTSLKFAIINYKKRNARYVFEDFIDEGYSAKETKLDLKIDIKRFLEKLPERQREIVLLHYVYGFKIKEIAKRIDVSVSTVNRELIALKEKLTKFLKV